MTDDFRLYSTLIEEFFPHSTHLLCVWHVYRAWKRKLSKLYNKLDSARYFHRLIGIQRILDPSIFKTKLNGFISTADSSLKEYLINNYKPRKEKWAACYRKCAGINVNMFIESMHKLLKRTYLKGKIRFK